MLRRLDYLFQRVGRNLLPGPVARWGRRLLRVVPGPETCWPDETAARYLKTAADAGHSLAGRRVMIFGAGPSYAVACRLVRAGASQVVLYDKFAAPDDRLNRPLLGTFGDLLEAVPSGIVPADDRIVVVAPTHDDDPLFPEVDVVLSSSVLEHVDNPEAWAGRLAAATASDGVNLHLIDLRDHFFASPFEMLRYSDETWRSWLNPRSHLNRFRMADYERAFQPAFDEVVLDVVHREEEAFAGAKAHIRTCFLTGDDAVDSATIVLLTAHRPSEDPVAASS